VGYEIGFSMYKRIMINKKIILKCIIIALVFYIFTVTTSNAQSSSKNEGDNLLELRGKIESLEKRFDKYEIEKTYFTNSLQDQANRFSLIVLALVSLGSLVSLFGFRWQLRSIREEISEVKKELENRQDEFENKIVSIESEQEKNIANHYVTISEALLDDLFYKFGFKLNAVQKRASRMKKYDLGKEGRESSISTMNSNLETCRVHLEEIDDSRKPIGISFEKRSSIISTLRDAKEVGNETTKDVSEMLEAIVLDVTEIDNG
jgi:hypothetical protein